MAHFRQMRKELEALRAEVQAMKAVVEAAIAMVSEPSNLSYPIKDVYGTRMKDDQEAPLWTESGLYGRLGKEAARTVLCRHIRLTEALAALQAGAR